MEVGGMRGWRWRDLMVVLGLVDGLFWSVGSGRC
jgi:hypothetical protein